MPSSPADILLTPTARLARQLVREQAIEASQRGATAWLPPNITTFSAWIGQLRQAHLLTGEDERVPISHQQAMWLWQTVIDHEVFIGEPQVARLAQQAWRTLHEYNLPQPDDWPGLLLSEDSRRFQDWSRAYRQLCDERGFTDEWVFAAELPALIQRGAVNVPPQIQLVGFDLPLTPLQSRIVAACEAVGASIERHTRAAHARKTLPVTECPTVDDELLTAAEWARGVLQASPLSFKGSALPTSVQRDPQPSIAIVVPNLSGRVERVERLMRRVFDPPGYALHGEARPAWHISLGQPLDQWPLVADALAILSLATDRITQPQAHQLLRSPFLQGGQASFSSAATPSETALSEAAARAQTLADLAGRAPFAVTAAELQWCLRRNEAAQLAQGLEQWLECRQHHQAELSASAWVAQFQAELSSLGFALGRPLDSREYQVLNRWHEVLETFSALDLVADSPLPRARALSLLRERVAEVVFRERNIGAPVEILGVEEALGSRFDAAWITGLDSDTWPGPTRRDALLPANLQNDLPAATSESCLQRAVAELEGLMQLAPELQGSFARGREEVAAELCSLVHPSSTTLMPPLPLPTPASMLVPQDDCQAPKYHQASTAGGTSVLRHQSSCPFRAFAEHRLGAVELRPPRPGLDAGQRGTITHKALEFFFRDINDQAALRALDPEELSARIRTGVDAALEEFTRSFRLTLSPAGRQLEQARTEQLIQRWIELELERGEFCIQAREQPITMSFGGLRLRGNIDRVDELADASTLVMDYKTGRSSKADWFPEARLHDPQLPAYAVSLEPSPQGICFAHIRPEQLRFDGLAAVDTQTQGVGKLEEEGYRYKTLNAWPELLTLWRTHLDHIGEAFVTGEAAVNPRAPNECQHCHLHSLCRVQERAPHDSLQDDQTDE